MNTTWPVTSVVCCWSFAQQELLWVHSDCIQHTASAIGNHERHEPHEKTQSGTSAILPRLPLPDESETVRFWGPLAHWDAATSYQRFSETGGIERPSRYKPLQFESNRAIVNILVESDQAARVAQLRYFDSVFHSA